MTVCKRLQHHADRDVGNARVLWRLDGDFVLELESGGGREDDDVHFFDFWRDCCLFEIVFLRFSLREADLQVVQWLGDVPFYDFKERVYR